MIGYARSTTIDSTLVAEPAQSLDLKLLDIGLFRGMNQKQIVSKVIMVELQTYVSRGLTKPGVS